jgi:single-stranded DNA-binding protein
MSAQMRVVGNVLRPVDKKMRTVDGESVPVYKFAMMSDAFKRSGDSYVSDPTKEFSVDVTLWNESLGDKLQAILKPGMKVEAFGDFHPSPWTTQEGSPRTSYNLTAESVNLSFVRVESVVMRPTRRQQEEAQLIEPAASRAMAAAENGGGNQV